MSELNCFTNARMVSSLHCVPLAVFKEYVFVVSGFSLIPEVEMVLTGNEKKIPNLWSHAPTYA